jgi:competence protein CoiA
VGCRVNWANDPSGVRVGATPGARAACPGCRSTVLAKCGDILAWHWAHEADGDCDPWHEPETRWHLDWKNRFPADWQETVIGRHRADVRTPSALVLEFQNSPISPEEITEREGFYGRLLWVVNASSFAKNVCLRDRDGYHSFRWLWPRKSLWAVRRPLYLDLGGGRLFRVKRVHDHVPCGGWGVLGTVDRFVSRIVRGSLQGAGRTA